MNFFSGFSAGNASQMPPSPLYQNIRYLRPPPVPPPDTTRTEDRPPALPPRNYEKFTSSQSDSALQTRHERTANTSLPSSSQNLHTDSPQVDSYSEQIRKTAKKYHPAAFSVVATKTPFSFCQSVKKEPIRSYEATSPRASVSSSPLATSPLTILNSTDGVREQNGKSESAMLQRGSSPEPPPLPPPPSQSRRMDAGSEDLPPPPQQPLREDPERHQEQTGLVSCLLLLFRQVC